MDRLSPDVTVHPSAIVDSDQIGARTRIHAFTHILRGAQIGEACKISDHVFLEGGVVVGNRVTIKNGVTLWDRVRIEDDVFLGPHCVFTNDLRPRAFLKKERSQFLPTLVKEGATIGAGAVIVCGTTIGRFAFVAAGAVVTRSVPDHGLVRGNPARLAGYICKCGQTAFRLNDGILTCPVCGTHRPVQTAP